MGENSFASNSRIGIFKKKFYWWIYISVVHSSRKIRFSISKIKGRGREKLFLIARYKYLFYFKISLEIKSKTM